MPRYRDAFQSVTLSDNTEYACNREGQGVFLRRYDGTWAQLVGTGQTPTFTSPQQFRRWLGGRYVTVGSRTRTISRSGWEVES